MTLTLRVASKDLPWTKAKDLRSVEEKIKCAWSLFDVDGNGSIDFEETFST